MTLLSWLVRRPLPSRHARVLLPPIHKCRCIRCPQSFIVTRYEADGRMPVRCPGGCRVAAPPSPSLRPRIHVGRRRCNKKKDSWRCGNWFAPERVSGREVVRCPSCRMIERKYDGSTLGQDRRDRFEVAHPGNHAERSKKSAESLGREHLNALNRKSNKNLGKEHVNARNKKYRDANREKLKADKDAWNATIQATYCKMFCKFGIHGLNGSFSQKLKMLGFKDAEHLKKHFSDRFDPEMSFDNHGVQRVNGPRMWHIGHMIIPQCAYDRESEADQERCFHRTNLAPQWADENLRQARKLASDEDLLKYRHLWPLHWNDKLPPAEERARIEGRAFEERFFGVHEDDLDTMLEVSDPLFDGEFDTDDEDELPTAVLSPTPV